MRPFCESIVPLIAHERTRIRHRRAYIFTGHAIVIRDPRNIVPPPPRDRGEQRLNENARAFHDRLPVADGRID